MNSIPLFPPNPFAKLFDIDKPNPAPCVFKNLLSNYFIEFCMVLLFSVTVLLFSNKFDFI